MVNPRSHWLLWIFREVNLSVMWANKVHVEEVYMANDWDVKKPRLDNDKYLSISIIFNNSMK